MAQNRPNTRDDIADDIAGWCNWVRTDFAEPAGDSGPYSGRTLFHEMAGTWDVKQRMWCGPGAEPTNLPAAVARRRLFAKTVVEEEMTLAPTAKGDAFTRKAYFAFNAVTRQYEYFSIDSRAPQMMIERSYEPPPQPNSSEQAIYLVGGMFVAPKWEEDANRRSDIGL